VLTCRLWAEFISLQYHRFALSYTRIFTFKMPTGFKGLLITATFPQQETSPELLAGIGIPPKLSFPLAIPLLKMPTLA